MVKKTIIIILIFLGILSMLFFKSNYFDRNITPHQKTTDVLANTPQVSVFKVNTIPLVVSQNYVGFVLAIKSVEIRPFIEGFIDTVYITGGDRVEQNAPLFLLEQGEYLADLDVKMANIMSATAAFENAKTYYERLQNAGTKAVAKSDLDKAKADFLTTGAEVGSAIAAYDAAQVMYNYTFINAPIAGKVGNIIATKGQYVAPSGEALAYLVQESPVRVVFSISNAEYLKAKQDNPNDPFYDRKIRLKLADGQIYEHSGRVGFLDNQVTSSTDSIQVFADFENLENILLPNAYVDVLVEEDISEAIVLPQRAVTLKTNGSFVWVVDKNGALQEKSIALAPQIVDESFYLVLSGLKAGDFVVLQKPQNVKAGQTVQIKINPQILPKTYTGLKEK